MYSYNLPEFRYPVFSVNFDPGSNVLYNQYGNKILLGEIEGLLQSKQHLILDFNRDHANFLYGPTSILAIYNYFSSLGFDNILYLTSENVPDKPAIRFFPAWLYHKSESYQNVRIQTKELRQYPISCLNRFPSPHRVYLFYHLLHKPYFGECLTSFIGIRNPYNKFTDVGAYNEIYKDIPENIKEFFESTKYSKMTESNIQDWNELHDPNYAAFTDTYLNIITESTYFHSFYTEKTAKPLVSEQLFVMVGGSKSISNLKELGFNCFDPLIDSGYDSIENWIERVDCVLKVLDTIYFDIEDIYFHYQKERKYNKEYFLSDSFRNKCLDQVRDLLK